MAQMVKSLPVMPDTWVGSMRWEDPLEKGMAPHFSILVWRISWAEEPGGLQYMGYFLWPLTTSAVSVSTKSPFSLVGSGHVVFLSEICVTFLQPQCFCICLETLSSCSLLNTYI